MTYANAGYTAVEPSGLLRFSNSSTDSVASGGAGTVIGNNEKIKMASTETLAGSNVATIASTGVITLPSGYYYLLEASLSIGDDLSQYENGTVYTQFYDEGSSSYIGVKSYQNSSDRNNNDAAQLFAMDDTARVWVDATASSKALSWRMISPTANYNKSDIFYTNNPVGLWVAWTRCLVWRFD